jgi:CHAT domain-containing protein
VPVRATDLTSRIPDDSTALLEYVTGSYGAPTTLFLLSRGDRLENLQALTLAPAASLENPIARFEALVQSGKESDAAAKELGQALLSPAMERLPRRIRRLVIVPDGPLHRLPFDALRLPDGRYAAQRFAISSAPSAGVLLSLWQHNRASSRPMRLLALGDPSFKSDPTLPRLRRSAREARLVARYSPHSEIRLRDDASAAYLKHADLTPYRVVHLATHTIVDEHALARTALVLAPGGGENGFAGPNDLARLRLNADLVVLSSCRSAGGVVVNGEGVQGLLAPLFQAGARSVVATEWEIGDRAALDFVKRLYRHLAESQGVGEALRLAKLEAIEARVPPREWAAFTVVGDPLVQVPLRPLPWWQQDKAYLAAAALAGGLALFYLLRRTRRARRPEPS